MIKGVKCPHCGADTGDLINVVKSSIWPGPGAMENVYKCNRCNGKWSQHYIKSD